MGSGPALGGQDGASVWGRLLPAPALRPVRSQLPSHSPHCDPVTGALAPGAAAGTSPRSPRPHPTSAQLLSAAPPTPRTQCSPSSSEIHQPWTPTRLRLRPGPGRPRQLAARAPDPRRALRPAPRRVPSSPHGPHPGPCHHLPRGPTQWPRRGPLAACPGAGPVGTRVPFLPPRTPPWRPSPCHLPCPPCSYPVRDGGPCRGRGVPRTPLHGDVLPVLPP